MNYPNLILLGPPGSGKDTQAGYIVRDFGYTEFGAGATLRLAATHDQRIIKYQAQGLLVPDDIIEELFIGFLRANQPPYLLNAFPRDLGQLASLNRAIKAEHLTEPLLLYLDIPSKEVIERLTKRGRDDDDTSTIQKRYKVFTTQTAPIIEAYSKSGRILRIDGRPPIETVRLQVHAEIVKLARKN